MTQHNPKEPYYFLEWILEPDDLDSITLYVEHGCPPGGFLSAVLANDFMEAVGRADSQNIHRLAAWAAYVYNEIPSSCHGSYEAVRAWTEQHARKEQPQ